MSGRFFKHLSDTESESEESEEEILTTKAPAQANYSFSDDEEETKRVVRSAKEKHYEELNNNIKLIRNHKKIKDISKLLNVFEDLVKSFQKAKNSVIDKEEGGKIPKFYIKCLVELDDFINENWEDRKNMNKNNSKSLTTLRQKLRKYNKDFEKAIQDYRENPDAEEDEEAKESDDDGSDSDVEVVKEPRAKSVEEDTSRTRTTSGASKEVSDDDDDSVDWDMSSDSDSSSSDDEDYGGNLAAKFLKKVVDTDKEKEGKKREKKVKEERSTRKKKDDGEGEWTTVEGSAAAEKPKMFAKDAEINHQVMNKKLLEVLAMRGKKRIDRIDQMDMLHELLGISRTNNFGPALEVKILLGIQSALTDYSSSSCMKLEVWNKFVENLEAIVDILAKNSDLTVSETIPEDQESFQNSPYAVQGCVITLTEKMDEEFTRMLQVCDAHSPEYIERLRDEIKVVSIISKVRKYLEENNRGSQSELCRIYMLTIDYLYYKFDQRIIEANELRKEKTAKHGRHLDVIYSDEQQKFEPIDETMNSMEIIDRLCKYIYINDATKRIRKLATLSQVYHHALHDNWFEARDLLLLSSLPSTILSLKSDIQLQLLYNRSLVQVGLCAFRHGHIFEAHSSLLDILLKGRVRELLAQGIGFNNKTVERSPEQAKLEKRYQVPFHKHINVDLIECVYLVSSMLLEIPDVASNEFSVRKKLISRSFFNQLRKSEEQPLIGVPEAMREHVVAASKAMRVGNWKQCRDFIINEKMNAKVWNFFYNADKVRTMLSQKIREESLRTYLFTYSFVYDSISIDTLAQMFELESTNVHSLISKMIINEELMASLDEPTRSVVMHRTEPSRIQSQALQLADKVNMLLDYNERLWELKMTPLGHFSQGGRFDRNYQNRQGNRQGGNRGNRQGGYNKDRSHYRDNRNSRNNPNHKRNDRGGHDRNENRGERHERNEANKN